jgi:hypothetical protein
MVEKMIAAASRALTLSKAKEDQFFLQHALLCW